MVIKKIYFNLEKTKRYQYPSALYSNWKTKNNPVVSNSLWIMIISSHPTVDGNKNWLPCPALDLQKYPMRQLFVHTNELSRLKITADPACQQREPFLHDRAPAEAVMEGTKETDWAKPGVLMVDPKEPDALKNAPLSILSPSDVQLHVHHSLCGVSSRLVT